MAFSESDYGHWPRHRFVAQSYQPGDFPLFWRDMRYQIHSPRDVVILRPFSLIDNSLLIVHAHCDSGYLSRMAVRCASCARSSPRQTLPWDTNTAVPISYDHGPSSLGPFVGGALKERDPLSVGHFFEEGAWAWRLIDVVH